MKFGIKPKLGLRTALICVLILSLGLGYFSRLVHQGKEQVSVAKNIPLPGKKNVYPKNISPYDAPISFRVKATIPSWLSWLPGSKDCVAVESLDFSGREHSYPLQVNAGQLSDINKLSSLKKLALWRTDITSGDLRALDNLKQLEVLDVHQCPNLDQDEVAAELHRWPSLRRVILGPQIRSNIAYTADSPKVIGNGVSNKGLAALVSHPNKPVRELKIRGFNRRSMGLVLQLRRLTSLEVVPDAGTDPQLLNMLALLPNLKRLRISGIPEVHLPFLKENRKDIRVSFSPAHYKSLSEVLEAWKGHVDTLRITFGRTSHQMDRDLKTFYIEGFSESDPQINLSARAGHAGQFFDYEISRLIIEKSPFMPSHEHLESRLERASLLEQLNKFYKLKELVLRYIKPSELPTISLRRLEHLSIEANSNTETQIFLGYNPELRSLAIKSYRNVSIIGWNRLTKIRRIFCHANFSLDPVEILQQLPQPDLLEELDFGWHRPANQPEMSEGLVEELTRFRNLKTCFFRSEDQEWHKKLQQHLPNLTNYVERMGRFDPAEERFEKAFAQLRITERIAEATSESAGSE